MRVLVVTIVLLMVNGCSLEVNTNSTKATTEKQAEVQSTKTVETPPPPPRWMPKLGDMVRIRLNKRTGLVTGEDSSKAELCIKVSYVNPSTGDIAETDWIWWWETEPK